VQVVLKLNRSRKRITRKKERKRERKKERKRISIVKDVDGTIQNIKYYASIRNTIHAYRTCMQYSDIKKEFMKELLYIIQIIQ